MSSQFPLLFSPIQIGSVEIRNRIAVTAHGTGMAENSLPGEQLINYYVERAKGGVGLIMVGSQQIHPTSPGITGLLCSYDDSVIPSHRRLAEALHRHGAKTFAQLSHMGFATTARPVVLWAPSAISEQRYGEVAHKMSHEEIEEIIEAFAAAAVRSVEAGMDGISVHCAHGLLLHQFMSPHSNKRTDAYGGSMEKRLRFPIEVIQRVRERIGSDCVLGVRVSGDELVEGGLTLDDMKEITPRLVEAGHLDFVDVSGGNDGDIMSNLLHQPSMGISTAPLAHLAAGIKEVVDVPVIHGTRINDPVLAEKLLEDGLTDMVGMCRALIADPHLPNKARAGQLEDIILCIACQQACSGRLLRGKHITCIGNPVSGRETEWATLEPATSRKKVVVVGGGVAGMEAAMVASKRGHDVVLFEKEAELGGQVLLAAKAPTREEIADVARYRVNQLKKLGVQVKTEVKATADMVMQENPDAVVIATGALPSRPDIPGSDGDNVVVGEDVLNGTVEVGKKVVVVDSVNYRRGPSIALFLAEWGKDVEILTEGSYVGYRMESKNFAFLSQQLFDKGVVLTPHTKVKAIEGNRVIACNVFTMAERVIDGVDTVVVVTPGRPNDRLYRELEGQVKEMHLAGDCIAPRDIEAAVLEGHRVGRML